MSRLDQILYSTRAGLPALRARRAALEAVAGQRPAPPDFAAALRRQTIAVIAEIKRRSPSAGAINEGLDPATLGRRYEGGGAAAISVLTDGPFFGGSLQDLESVVATVALPVLRKDFIVDPVQLIEARASGAAAALLIVRVLDQAELVDLLGMAKSLGLAALVEAHTALEVRRAIDAGAAIIGVNARDLDSFEIATDAAWRLLGEVPAECVAVAESGMSSVADVTTAAAAGADAVLIGSALARAPNPEAQVRAISGVERHGR
jgi:indole-3-glycerol phosphate synthase